MEERNVPRDPHPAATGKLLREVSELRREGNPGVVRPHHLCGLDNHVLHDGLCRKNVVDHALALKIRLN